MTKCICWCHFSVSTKCANKWLLTCIWRVDITKRFWDYKISQFCQRRILCSKKNNILIDALWQKGFLISHAIAEEVVFLSRSTEHLNEGKSFNCCMVCPSGMLRFFFQKNPPVCWNGFKRVLTNNIITFHHSSSVKSNKLNQEKHEIFFNILIQKEAIIANSKNECKLHKNEKKIVHRLHTVWFDFKFTDKNSHNKRTSTKVT